MTPRKDGAEKALPSRILLVEDDNNLGLLLKESLGLHGYDVALCRDGEEALRVFLSRTFDLCLIDVMLPKKDGFTLGREIRRIHSGIPLIFLTAKSLQEDRIEGFRIGGDDYITKPFNLEELALRMRAVLRRSKAGSHDAANHTKYQLGSYVFDYHEQTLSCKGSTRKLTTKESELLRLLCLHANNVLERRLALQLVWGGDSIFNSRSMDVFISRLRKYLGNDEMVAIINVHGRGHKLVIRGA